MLSGEVQKSCFKKSQLLDCQDCATRRGVASLIDRVLFSHLRGNFVSSNEPIIERNSKYAKSEWRTGETGDKWLVASQACMDTLLVRKTQVGAPGTNMIAAERPCQVFFWLFGVFQSTSY